MRTIDKIITKCECRYGNDPIYLGIVKAKSKAKQVRAIELCKSVRGESAYKTWFYTTCDHRKTL